MTLLHICNCGLFVMDTVLMIDQTAVLIVRRARNSFSGWDRW